MRHGLETIPVTRVSVSIPFDFSSQSLSFSFERTALLVIEPHFGFIHGRTIRFCHGLLSPTSKSVGFVVLNWKCAGIRNQFGSLAVSLL